MIAPKLCVRSKGSQSKVSKLLILIFQFGDLTHVSLSVPGKIPEDTEEDAAAVTEAPSTSRSSRRATAASKSTGSTAAASKSTGSTAATKSTGSTAAKSSGQKRTKSGPAANGDNAEEESKGDTGV